MLALAEFGRRGYDAVSVTELAAAAGVTTGSLYHHFGNKAGLYGFVREEAERRLIDRMEGAAAAVGGRGQGAVRMALLVGFDFAVRERFAALLAEPHPERPSDPVERFLARLTERASSSPLSRLLAATWRAALAEATRGSAQEVRAALDALLPEVALVPLAPTV